MIPSTIHSSWHPYLSKAFDSDAMKFIKSQLLPSITFSPSAKNIFNVLSMPLDNVRVVIIGDYPYGNIDLDIGYAFAIPTDTKPTVAINNIVDEIAISTAFNIALLPGKDFDVTLEHWKKQGVFLLNRSLTAQCELPSSHYHYWKGFTELIIKTLAEQSKGLVWILWNNDAKEISELIMSYDNAHNVLVDKHPTNKISNFLGCKIFAITNQLLNTEIDWDGSKTNI